VRAGNPSRDSKPKSRTISSSRRARVIGSEETLEDTLARFERNTGASVADVDAPTRTFVGQVDVNPTTVTRVLDRVHEQIVDRTTQKRFVAFDRSSFDSANVDEYAFG
jgi:hypothetical protein